jgi:hypothetical protein
LGLNEDEERIAEELDGKDKDGDGLPDDSNFGNDSDGKDEGVTPPPQINPRDGGDNGDEEDTQEDNQTCTLLDVIQDDSQFNDLFITEERENIAWSSQDFSVKGIEEAFNNARAKDSTVNTKITLPSQSVWDGMSIQEKGLYLLNKERYDRGVKLEEST